MERPKSRLVIRGCNQQFGVDYKHTFSLEAKLAIIKVVIALATTHYWPIYQLNVNNAFLHSILN